jgi:hypothetical protein
VSNDIAEWARQAGTERRAALDRDSVRDAKAAEARLAVIFDATSQNLWKVLSVGIQIAVDHYNRGGREAATELTRPETRETTMTKKWRELYDQIPADRRARIDAQVARDLAEMPLNELRRARELSQVRLAEALETTHGSLR